MTSRGRTWETPPCVRGSVSADVKSGHKHRDDGEGKHVRGAQTGLAWYGVGCGRAGRPLGGRRWEDSPHLPLLSGTYRRLADTGQPLVHQLTNTGLNSL